VTYLTLDNACYPTAPTVRIQAAAITRPTGSGRAILNHRRLNDNPNFTSRKTLPSNDIQRKSCGNRWALAGSYQFRGLVLAASRIPIPGRHAVVNASRAL
jgi:hypothetical protein